MGQLPAQWEIFIDFGVNTEIISGVFANGVMVVIYTKILHLYYTQFDWPNLHCYDTQFYNLIYTIITPKQDS